MQNTGNIEAGLSSKARTAIELKEAIEHAKLELDRAQDLYDKVCFEIMNTLEAMDVESIKMEGFTFYIQSKESVKTPKTLEEKKAFFDHLREKGLFEEMVSVNSMTLNSYYKSMAEEALEQGILEFKLPGIEAPTTYKQLKIRKS